MYENNVRSVFPDLNIPKQEKVLVKEELSYEDKLRIAVEHLAKFADFHEVKDKLEHIKEEEMRKSDPVLNFLYRLKKITDKEEKV